MFSEEMTQLFRRGADSQICRLMSPTLRMGQRLGPGSPNPFSLVPSSLWMGETAGLGPRRVVLLEGTVLGLLCKKDPTSQTSQSSHQGPNCFQMQDLHHSQLGAASHLAIQEEPGVRDRLPVSPL